MRILLVAALLLAGCGRGQSTREQERAISACRARGGEPWYHSAEIFTRSDGVEHRHRVDCDGAHD